MNRRIWIRGQAWSRRRPPAVCAFRAPHEGRAQPRANVNEHRQTRPPQSHILSSVGTALLRGRGPFFGIFAWTAAGIAAHGEDPGGGSFGAARRRNDAEGFCGLGVAALCGPHSPDRAEHGRPPRRYRPAANRRPGGRGASGGRRFRGGGVRPRRDGSGLRADGCRLRAPGGQVRDAGDLPRLSARFQPEYNLLAGRHSLGGALRGGGGRGCREDALLRRRGELRANRRRLPCADSRRRRSEGRHASRRAGDGCGGGAQRRRGAVIGRNIWGFENIAAAVHAFKAVIHDGQSADAALRQMETAQAT